MLHPFTKFHTNRDGSFCLILFTLKQTNIQILTQGRNCLHDTCVFLLLQLYIFLHSTLSPGFSSVTVGLCFCGEYYMKLQLPLLLCGLLTSRPLMDVLSVTDIHLHVFQNTKFTAMKDNLTFVIMCFSKVLTLE